MEDARLTHLLNCYLDGALPPSEKVELEHFLLESAAARRHFWEFATLHALTHEAAKWRWTEQSQFAPEPMPQPETAVVSAESSTVRRPRPSRLGWAWGLAAACVLSLLGVWMFYGRTGEKPVATLVRAVEAEWSIGTNGPVAEDLLKPGRLRLERGAVQIQFFKGASLVVEAPAEFRLVSETEAFCDFGRFFLEAPGEARGFTLSMEGARVVDLGTEFGMNIPPAGLAEVHVFSGRVDVTRVGPASPSIELLEGEAIRLDADGFSRRQASRMSFLSAEDLARRELPEVRARQVAWRAASEALNADPSAILHYMFEDQSPWETALPNRVQAPLPETHGDIIGCAWGEGRWPGKKALLFSEPSDRVRLDLPQPFEEVTCLAWLNVKGLTNLFVHSIMTGDSEEAGTLRWTISHQGNIRFGIANKSSGPEASWALAMSRVEVKPARFGQWFLLTTVFDGKKAFHYLDGKLVWSGAVNSPKPLRFGWVEVGNWAATRDHADFQWAKGRKNSYFERHFRGRIGEIAVLARAMSHEEIQNFYEAGKPVAPENLAQLVR